MPKKSTSPSQLMELFLAVADELGFQSDQDVAALADVGPESVGNWRAGSVKEFKKQKFQAALATLRVQLRALSAQAGLGLDNDLGLSPLEIEDGSSPSDLHRQFRDQVGYDYLGHRFLYFEPQGALAWERLIKVGYEQDSWLGGVEECCERFLSNTRDSGGAVKGPLAQLLGLGRRDRARGLEVISLGPGEGGKEARILEHLMSALEGNRSHARYLGYVPVDVSIALLLKAAGTARDLFANRNGSLSRSRLSVLPVCSDFEEGNLAFGSRLRDGGENRSEERRLVLFLGNVLGNVRDEEVFVKQKLGHIVRPGDALWIEVGLRAPKPENDPLFELTKPDREETAGQANRRLLLEGPYRRYLVASGRAAGDLDLRIRVREGDGSSRVPGSYNFCHDLLIRDEGRSVTMLYSRRYDLAQLGTWFESMGYAVDAIHRTKDSQGRNRVGHLLLRRVGTS
ncbi:MAG: L-histidine N(alpha)-methyltransferase [Myxococcales bacterium]|nr:L-histidine N(alpha)-methyltransferase [Myxococcales bacterium]